ncbi:MAG: TauD/TfdA family dioxygenase [Pseudomonadota bacterium]
MSASSTISIAPCDGPIGARITGLSLRHVPSDDQIESIEDALEKYGVLIFPNQTPRPEELIAFSRAFAELELTELAHAQLEGHREIFVVGNTGDELVTFSPAQVDGELEWHTDHIHRQVPARASLLYALEVPPTGGDTLFACMYQAYDSLSKTQQADYSRYEIETSAWGLERYLARQGHQLDLPTAQRRSYETVVRPLVRAHPRSGRHALYFGNQVSLCIKGWDEGRTREFIEALTEHACQLNFQYRHQWTAGDAVLWDNRRVLHAGTPYDTKDTRRRLYRTTWREPNPPTLVDAQAQ